MSVGRWVVLLSLVWCWPRLGSCAEGAGLDSDPIELLSYPNKPIHLVVPWPPQGGADLLARFLAERLTESLRQRVTVDNRPGAGGNTGADFVAKSRPDGYVLLVNAGDTHVINPVVYGAQMPFNGVHDFAPIALLAHSDFALAVNPSVKVRSVDELVAHARANPKQIRIATSGPGTRGHLLAGMLQQRTGIDVLFIPHTGSAAASIAVAGGNADAVFSTYSAMAAQVKAHKLRLVAVSSRRQGYGGPVLSRTLADFELDLYFGLFGPRETPREIVERLNLHANRTMQTPGARAKLRSIGFEPDPGSPDAFARTLAADSFRWSRALAGMKLVVE